MSTNLILLHNEGVILQRKEIIHKGKIIDELYLTNLNLKYVESSGVFKVKYTTIEYPLNQIRIINGKAQVSVIDDKDESTWILQIVFKNGIERFAIEYGLFNKNKVKSEIDAWAEQICFQLTGQSFEKTNDSTLLGSVKNALETVGVKLKTPEADKVTSKCIGCMAPISGVKGQFVCCKYCDTDQTI